MAGLSPEASDELEALACIYGHEAFTSVPEEGRCQVSVQLGDGQPELVARFLLPPDYPRASPPFAELEARPRQALRAEDLETLGSQIASFWEDGGRVVVLFQYTEFLREQLAALCPPQEPEAPQAVAAAEQEDRAADGAGTSDGGAWEEELTPEEAEALAAIVEQSFRADREAKKAGKPRGGADTVRCPEDDLERRISGRMIHGIPFTERKSTFQGHVCPVESVDEVEAFISFLLENKKIAAATHNMMAYRIDCGKGVWSQDSDDDGEQGALLRLWRQCDDSAGGRLLRLLQMTNARNVCVVVSRWFGGTLLGPDRFKLINNCARDVLSENGFISQGQSAGAGGGQQHGGGSGGSAVAGGGGSKKGGGGGCGSSSAR